MGAAAYNRGSARIAREADERMPGALAKSERQAHRDEVARLREQVSRLKRDLARARRCLAAERHGREQLRRRLMSELSTSAFAVSVLCRLAFPDEHRGRP